MPRDGFPMALKSHTNYLVLPAILLTALLLIDLASCKSHGPTTNSSLKSQTIYRYSKQAALSFPYQQTRTCSSEGGACSSAKDCCQFDSYEYACAKFSGSSPTCQQCISNGLSCSEQDTNNQCCTGSICSGGTCVPTGTCIGESNACYPGNHQCCEDLNCIIDPEGKSYCSDDCSASYGECPTAGSSDYCCPGYFCLERNEGPRCACGNLGESCEAGADPKTCCAENECDSSTSTCQNCIAPRKSCNQAGETRTCCSSLPCDDAVTGTCCLAKDATCDPNAPEATCCNGLVCIKESETCQPCIEAGNPCTPGTPTCCGINYCSWSSKICCTAEDDPCDPAHDTCCDDLKCLTIGDSSTCKPECIDIVSSCNVTGDPRTCCEGSSCDVSASYCCWGLGHSCLESPTHNYCCTGLKCSYAAGGCIPDCIGAGGKCTSGTDTCCGDNECIETDGVATCKPPVTCAVAGESCKSQNSHGWGWGPAGSNECCSPFTCDSYNYKCCAAAGATCDDSPCCRGLECKLQVDSSKVCEEKPCVSRGSSCDETDICCGRLTCDPSAKVCLGGAWEPCDDITKLCSSDHKCDPNSSVCKPIRCYYPYPFALQTICLKDPHQITLSEN